MTAYSAAQIFAAELAGTFALVVAATGSIVYDDLAFGGRLGAPFAAAVPFAALAACVYLFGRVSMAHFNPAVTAGYYITGHISGRRAACYLAAELAGALFGSLFVMALAGGSSSLGANMPSRDYPLSVTFPVEVLASSLLMAVIFCVVYVRGMRRFSGVAIGGMVGLDILLFAAVSGASMNPARALAPALLSWSLADLWLYWTAPYLGTAAVALLFRRRFRERRDPLPPGAP